ncbi:hypothetical protein V3I01_11830 [Sphingomonas sp. gentR]|uniref:hypothetical protein n=1 Tax=unclassified Sphingomonas TaxID=196159 RepID=UPI0009756830|nr:hypothetical protein [Sphingomonas sp. LK11]
MRVKTHEQLEAVRDECKNLVTKRALAAGAASAVPYAVAGVAADVAILLELLPKINRKFGLDPDQIDELDEQMRQQVIVIASKIGSELIGRAITKELITSVLKAVGVRATTKAAASWVPIIGSAVGGALGFGMMKYVGNQHVEECYQVVSRLLSEQEATAKS